MQDFGAAPMPDLFCNLLRDVTGRTKDTDTGTNPGTDTDVDPGTDTWARFAALRLSQTRVTKQSFFQDVAHRCSRRPV